MSATRATCVLAAILSTACASGPARPVVDLTPFAWTGSQIPIGDAVIRYGFPDEPAAPAGASDEATAALVPAGSGANQTRLASHRYGCAREDRGPDAACTVFLDFWLVELDPQLVDLALPAYRDRLERDYGDAPSRGSASALVRDSHGREWVHRAVELPSGGEFAHYSRPIDARHALVVTSLTTRAPDRIAARDLARDAIDRTVISAPPE